MHILVTGATGYVGGRLVPDLIAAGHTVRVLVRQPSTILGRSWSSAVGITVGDVLERESLERALDGVDVAYYLVHSMLGPEFEELDRVSAETFASVVPPTLRKVIYLGWLMESGEQPSKHLRSRAEVGAILASRTPVLELRAGPIIGSGSAFFELIRYVTERSPVIVAPRWVDNQVQPISIDDVLRYLVAAATLDATGIVEIGSDPLTFREMMRTYAEARGLRRMILAAPAISYRHLAAFWVSLVTPIPNVLALPLIDSIFSPALADTGRARSLMPEIEPVSYLASVGAALDGDANVETRWSDAPYGSAELQVIDTAGTIREVRSVVSSATPARLFQAFTSLGGQRGWLAWNLAWRLRGVADKIVGGPGLRRGRRHPQHLVAGEAVDFWRVEAIERGRLLRLRAEMKVPGPAWLQWEVVDDGAQSRLVQTAIFIPHGLWGALYWYALYPLHARIFSDLANAIVREAEKKTPLEVRGDR